MFMGQIKLAKEVWQPLLEYLKIFTKRKRPLPVVRPGTQSRRFTHIDDTVKICFMAWKKNLCRHYSISHRESFSIIKVAKMFKRKIKYLPRRAGGKICVCSH